MAKKIKHTFEDVMNAMFKNEEVIDWNGVSISVKRTIGLAESLDFVKSVVESCFDDAGVYMPELRDFAFRTNIIRKYTDIALPVEAEKQYALLYRTNLYGFIINAIDEGQISVICQAIDEKVVYECDTQMREIRARLDKMIESLGTVADSTMALFGGIGKEDIEKLAKAAVDGKPDEAAIVAAFLDQKK